MDCDGWCETEDAASELGLRLHDALYKRQRDRSMQLRPNLDGYQHPRRTPEIMQRLGDDLGVDVLRLLESLRRKKKSIMASTARCQSLKP